jgi:hypothetical protein
MEARKKIDILRDVIIYPSPFKVTVNKENLRKAVETLKDGDEVIGMAERSGFYQAEFSMNEEEQYYHHWAFVVRNQRDETDDEYYERLKKHEQNLKQIEEKEKLEYLRLKAKFEGEI